MTIKKGEAWGRAVLRPDGLVAAATDAELAWLVSADPVGTYTVTGGDLHHSLGAPSSRDEMQMLPMDALLVRFDDQETLAVAHVVARNSWWRGELLGVFNCGDMGHWNVAPRSHPNDGHFDIIEVGREMSIRQRFQAGRRAPHGTHLPHPAIAVRRSQSETWQFESERDIYVDGVRRGRCSRLAITISPDHFAIHM